MVLQPTVPLMKKDIPVNMSCQQWMYTVKSMEGNTLLHKKQYLYEADELAQFIVHNKICNQRQALNQIRKKTQLCKEAITLLDEYIERLETNQMSMESLLGLEGSASRVYFPQMFDIAKWQGRKPRVKFDYINTTLDIGYNLLFNMVDSLLQVFGFDVYYGIYHREFYMRKSLVCDLMEPMRPIIDYRVRTAINLSQCKEEDFQVVQNQYQLSYKKSPAYVEFLMEEILEHKQEMFVFIQSYYRNFMKGSDIDKYPMFLI